MLKSHFLWFCPHSGIFHDKSQSNPIGLLRVYTAAVKKKFKYSLIMCSRSFASLFMSLLQRWWRPAGHAKDQKYMDPGEAQQQTERTRQVEAGYGRSHRGRWGGWRSGQGVARAQAEGESRLPAGDEPDQGAGPGTEAAAAAGKEGDGALATKGASQAEEGPQGAGGGAKEATRRGGASTPAPSPQARWGATGGQLPVHDPSYLAPPQEEPSGALRRPAAELVQPPGRWGGSDAETLTVRHCLTEVVLFSSNHRWRHCGVHRMRERGGGVGGARRKRRYRKGSRRRYRRGKKRSRKKRRRNIWRRRSRKESIEENRRCQRRCNRKITIDVST